MPKRARSFKKKGSFKKKAFKKTKTTVSSSTNQVATSSSSSLMYSGSKITRCPVPDSYKTWLTTELLGHYVAAASGSIWAFAVNGILDPFNFTGGTGTAIPNPNTAVNALSPMGARNLLFNNSTNTGLYLNYRVWRTQVNVSVVPEVFGDVSLVGIAPITDATHAYANSQALCQAPNSANLIISAGAATRTNSVTANWSMPALLGVKPAEYGTLAGASAFQASSTPTVYAAVSITPTVGGSFDATININVKMMQFVEFFGPVNTAMIDN